MQRDGLLDRAFLEATVLSVTSAQLSYSLAVSGLPGAWCGVLGLTCLTGLVVRKDLREQSVRSDFGYVTRVAASDGLGVGSLALPWAFAGLVVLLCKGSQSEIQRDTVRDQHPFPMLALVSCEAASTAILLLLEHSSYQHSPARRAPQSKVAPSYRTRSPEGSTIESQPILARNAAHEERTSAPSAASTELCASRGNPGERPQNSANLLSKRHVPMVHHFSGLLIFLIALLASSYMLRPNKSSASSSGSSAYATALIATTACITMHALLSYAPRCFTIGEAMVAAQALSLLLWNTLTSLVSRLELRAPLTSSTRALQPEAIKLFVEVLLVAVLVAGLLATPFFPSSCLGRPMSPSPSAAAPNAASTDKVKCSKSTGCRQGWRTQWSRSHLAVIGILALGAVAALNPALWVVRYVATIRNGPHLVAYWVVLLGAAVPLMHWTAHHCHVPVILVRKGYHLLAVALFVPALLVAPQLLALAMGIALALMLVLEVVRLAELPFVGRRLQAFMISFTDSRDVGPLLISHVSLLTGCATPVWLTVLGAAARNHPTHVGAPVRTLILAGVPAAGYAGIVALGVLDSAASAVGLRFGRHRMFTGSNKTVEGTIGGTVTAVGAWLALIWVANWFYSSGSVVPSITVLAQIMAATVAASLLEASTTQLDNVFLPLHLFSLLCLL